MLTLTSDLLYTSQFYGWSASNSAPVLIVSYPVSREVAGRANFGGAEVRKDEIALREMLNLNHVSVLGCQELMKLSSEPEFRTCLDAIIRQRLRHSDELFNALRRVACDSAYFDLMEAAWADPNCVDLRKLWVRAAWSFEQDQFVIFSEQIELVESMLEDAYLAAAEAVQSVEVAQLFIRNAIELCESRQRLEDLSYKLN